MLRVRHVTIASAVVALVTLGVAASAAGAPSAAPPGVTAISSVPNVSIGDTVTLTGFVGTDSVPVPGIDVTVKLYTLPDCASGASPRTVLTTAADGTFTYTETLAVNPPVSYGFIVGLAQNPGRTPNFSGPDSCVTLNAAPKLSAKADGDVVVNGGDFTSGVISYGSTVDVSPGASVNLATDAGRFKFFPVKGAGATFVPVRLRLPGTGKKRFVIELRLVGGDFSTCKPGTFRGFRTQAAAKPGPPRSLWGNGKGNYRTRGRYSSATVSGTSWLVVDLCGGTLTVVRSGTVRVFDFVKKKTIVLHAGQRYLARPR